MNRAISFIVPCLNEEANVANTVGTIEKTITAIAEPLNDYEIIISNNASTDQTGAIADELAKKNPHIRVLHYTQSAGLGESFIKAARASRMPYCMLVPGDNEITNEAIRSTINELGMADIIAPYTKNPQIRSVQRQIISKLFTLLINTIFGLHFKYFNGIGIFKTADVNSLHLVSTGFTYMAEIIVLLVKTRGATYREVGMLIQPRGGGESKALRYKNFKDVWQTVISLIRRVYFNQKA